MCLFTPDLVTVRKCLEEEFRVEDSDDKVEALGNDKMGYQGLNLNLKLGSGYAGPRYDDLRDLKCEVQVRTVMQDSWATISHSLVYKDKQEIPPDIIRKLNRVSSILETAQEQFDQVEKSRSDYLSQLQDLHPNKASFLDGPLDFDSLLSYTKWKYPSLEPTERIQSLLFRDIEKTRYKTLRDLDGAIERATKAVNAYAQENPTVFRFGTDYITKSLGFVDEDFRRRHPFASFTRAAFEMYGHLVD